MCQNIPEGGGEAAMEQTVSRFRRVTRILLIFLTLFSFDALELERSI